jgi:ABC-type oligopeptide transport system substrate-binding subunit
LREEEQMKKKAVLLTICLSLAMIALSHAVEAEEIRFVKNGVLLCSNSTQVFPYNYQINPKNVLFVRILRKSH